MPTVGPRLEQAGAGVTAGVSKCTLLAGAAVTLLASLQLQVTAALQECRL